MQLKKLADTLSVTAQISVADVADLASRGFAGIINNRADGKGDDQPTSAALQAAAQQAGLGYRHIPVVPGQVHDTQVQAFARARDELPGPVLAFCRTGTRATTLWALNAVHERDVDQVLQQTADAGYDLAALRPRMLQAHSAAAGRTAADAGQDA